MKKGNRLKTIEEYWTENEQTLKAAGYTKNIFAQNMKQLMKTNNVRTSGAWKLFKRKREFTDPVVIGAENLVSGIKQLDPTGDEYKRFRKEVVGWKNKLDYSKFTYNGSNYIYNKSASESYIFTLISGAYGSQYWTWSKQ